MLWMMLNGCFTYSMCSLSNIWPNRLMITNPIQHTMYKLILIGFSHSHFTGILGVGHTY